MSTNEITLSKATKTHSDGRIEEYYINPNTGNRVIPKCPDCGCTHIKDNITCEGCGYEYFAWDWEEVGEQH